MEGQKRKILPTSAYRIRSAVPRFPGQSISVCVCPPLSARLALLSSELSSLKHSAYALRFLRYTYCEQEVRRTQ
ncbi:hypothetical protein NL676_016448 [Syzygium grande]|nr:hypothetical protein NL676_016448 [Syzygium grande]